MGHKMQVSTRFSSKGTASWQLISSYTHCTSNNNAKTKGSVCLWIHFKMKSTTKIK